MNKCPVCGRSECRCAELAKEHWENIAAPTPANEPDITVEQAAELADEYLRKWQVGEWTLSQLITKTAEAAVYMQTKQLQSDISTLRAEHEATLDELARVREALATADSVLKWVMNYESVLPASADGTPAWHILNEALGVILAARAPGARDNTTGGEG